MPDSSNLLKSAIADAKAVRQTALANARAALQEAFTPKLQSMLSAKLQQEVAEEEEANAAPVDVTVNEPEADLPIDAPGVGLDAGVATAPDSEPVASEPTNGVAAGCEVPSEEEPPMDEYQTLGSGNPDPVEKSLELTEEESYELKTASKGAVTKNDKNIVAPNASSKKDGKATTKFSKNEKEVSKATEDYPGEKSGTGAKPTGDAVKDYPKGGTRDVEKPGNNVAPGASSKKDGKATTNLKENDEIDIDDQSLDEILKELENEVNQAAPDHLEDPALHAAPQSPKQDSYPGTSVCEDEEINLDELLREDADDESPSDKETDDKSKASKAADKKSADKDDADTKPSWLKENNSLKEELQEYRNTVKSLRNTINEVNLLNAKLLYTNKLFKQGAFTNEQKVRIIEAFDLTKSVREAKIVFATLSESLNFGANKATVGGASSSKSTSSATVRTITEGLASKAIASTKPTKPVLTEGAVMANRFQKLAGIKVK
jgi:hypothetical protein